MEVNHFITGARGSLRLVRDDEDRFQLLAASGRAFGRTLLAYCIMDTHLHLVAEMSAEEGKRRLVEALAAYARGFNRRHGEDSGPLLRGPVQEIASPGALELLRLLRYVHWNPIKATPPLVGRAIEYRWSSARAFAGLSLAGVVDVERARALVGASPARIAIVETPLLADLDPSAFPTVMPREVLAAAADVYGAPPAALLGGRRGGAVAAARALYMRLGALEGFTPSQLAGPIGRSASQARRCAQVEVSDAALRAARTLLRDAGMRARLPRAA